MIRTSLLTLCSLALSGVAFANSPLDGTWFNSFCSRVDITVEDGTIDGVYTSHTGSTGASRLVGQIDDAVPEVPPKGLPFSAGIQWRLVNVDQANADGSWHWVSTFSGQYHPAQTVMGSHQAPYQIPETLVILNGLLATGTVPGLTNEAPVLWPQTLTFHRAPPVYCQTVTPPEPVPFTATATDTISGTWTKTDGSKLSLSADLLDGAITGTYEDVDQASYNVYGLFDALAPPASGYSVPVQGVTLTLKENSSPTSQNVKIFAGGVSYANTSEMFLWESNLQSTTWIDRFIQQDLDKGVWTKQ